jgi:hypothetical protein
VTAFGGLDVRVGWTFVAGLVLGAVGALAIERLVDRPPAADAPAPATSPTPSDTPLLAALPKDREITENIGVGHGAPVPLIPSGPPGDRALARFDDAMARGTIGEALTALDDALVARGADWPQVRDRVSRLPPVELERWVVRHGDELNRYQAAELLLDHGKIDAGLDVVARILSTDGKTAERLVRHALEVGGERALSLLEGRPSQDDPNVGLVVADWLADHDRKDEAIRRVVEAVTRRTPRLEEIDWLSSREPRAAAAAARTLAERERGSPRSLASLAHALEASGDATGAFDAYAAALRSGLSADDGAYELVRVDPVRAAAVLLELYGGRGDESATEALGVALLRSGRAAEAVRELLRWTLTENGAARAAQLSHIDAAAVIAALEPRFPDLAAIPASDADLLAAYGTALRVAARKDDAMRVLRAAAERLGHWPGPALVEMMRCDPTAAREFVESHLPKVGEDSITRVRLLGMLGRTSEATALFDGLAGGDAARLDKWAALAPADPERVIRELRRVIADDESEGGEPDEQRTMLARVFADLGRTAEAKAAWARLSHDRDGNLESLIERAALR